MLKNHTGNWSCSSGLIRNNIDILEMIWPYTYEQVWSLGQWVLSLLSNKDNATGKQPWHGLIKSQKHSAN